MKTQDLKAEIEQMEKEKEKYKNKESWTVTDHRDYSEICGKLEILKRWLASQTQMEERIKELEKWQKDTLILAKKNEEIYRYNHKLFVKKDDKIHSLEAELEAKLKNSLSAEEAKEIMNITKDIPHFDDIGGGYNCPYCGVKTYGLGKELTCEHSEDCLWVRKNKVLEAFKKKEGD